jgi:pullulanase
MMRSLLCLSLLCSGQAMADDVCDGPFQTVLNASDDKREAQAVWLNGHQLQWSGAKAGGSFKLYHAAQGGIHAAVGGKVSGAQGELKLDITSKAAASPVLTPQAADTGRIAGLLSQQLVLVQEADDGKVLASTRIQHAAALDNLYAVAEQADDLGVSVGHNKTSFKLWAPTAQKVTLCVVGRNAEPMQRIDATGIWHAALPRDLSGGYYTYAVDVFVDGTGLVRNRVTDPYSVSLDTDSRHSYVANLDAAALKPPGWDQDRTPATVKAQTDMVVYELHVRDFSINDASVSAANRGKYAAFTETKSNGMRHLAALARAGLTDIHLLPIYDLSTIPEKGCAMPQPSGAPDSDAQQALVGQTREVDCFNWGYDPYHYNAPEGSYTSDPSNGARRILEVRQMVMALHKAGLRVGMDVVYNHTFAAGQNEKSVLDRIVPGYYHRLNAKGAIEHSTCCENTATENRMMAKLMSDSVLLWARHYRIDSFRFDLMGHQPRAAMEALGARVNAAVKRPVQLIGEGWNFGEVADGARFVQASQLSLGGSGIGTFSDRARDAVRGGSASDSGDELLKRQGYINGMAYDPNGAGLHTVTDLMQASDMVKVGLAGTLRNYRLQTHMDETLALDQLDYNGQGAGYATAPGEAVNYVENHDNQTLYDINVFRLPLSTTSVDRARVQMLGAAINMFSQGVAYFHAGIDTLRSKSLDRNSFNSGDWFNRIDWTYQDNYFGTGLPLAEDNGKDFAILKPLLANAAIKPKPADIAFARDAFRDLLAIRASSTLFRLRTSAEVEQRLHFANTGSKQVPTVIAAHLDGRGYAGARFASVAYFINVDKVAHTVAVNGAAGKNYRLHPVHSAARAADKRAATARFDKASGSFTIPPRTAVVFVQ